MANLERHKSSVGGSRRFGRYFFQIFKSEEASETYYSPISIIDDTGPPLERQEALVPVWRLWTVIKVQWLDHAGLGGILFKSPGLKKLLKLTRGRYLV